MPEKPFTDTEVTISVRRVDGHLTCAFVSAVARRQGGQMAIIDSRHIAELDEVLLDRAIQLSREWLLEWALSPCEPF